MMTRSQRTPAVAVAIAVLAVLAVLAALVPLAGRPPVPDARLDRHVGLLVPAEHAVLAMRRAEAAVDEGTPAGPHRLPLPVAVLLGACVLAVALRALGARPPAVQAALFSAHRILLRLRAPPGI
jgi:hypothetical protein